MWSVLEAHNSPCDVAAGPKGLPEAWVRSWTAELVDAVEWLHSSGWAHRFVSPRFLKGLARVLTSDYLPSLGISSRTTYCSTRMVTCS